MFSCVLAMAFVKTERGYSYIDLLSRFLFSAVFDVFLFYTSITSCVLEKKMLHEGIIWILSRMMDVGRFYVDLSCNL